MPLKIFIVLMWVDLFTACVAAWAVVAWAVEKLTESNLGISHPLPSLAVFIATLVLAWLIAKVSDKFETAQSPAGD